jgi:hypothetical protein
MKTPTKISKTCELHSEALLEGVASVRYDLFNGRNEYVRATEQFPNAHSFKLYGAGPRPKQQTVKVLYCPKCRAAEQQWWAAHKKWWQFWK